MSARAWSLHAGGAAMDYSHAESMVAKQSRAIRSALKKAVDRNEIPPAEYEVRSRQRGATYFHTVRLVLGKPSLRLFVPRHLYGRVASSEDFAAWRRAEPEGMRTFEQVMARTNDYSQRWYALRDRIEQILRVAGFSVAPSVSGSPAPLQVQVVTPTDYCGELGSPQYVVERSLALREYLLLKAAFSERATYMRLLFIESDEALQAALERAERGGVTVAFDPRVEGWHGGGVHDARRGAWWEKEWRNGLHGRIWGVGSEAYDYAGAQVHQEVVKRISDAIVGSRWDFERTTGAKDAREAVAQWGSAKSIRWIVWDYRTRARRYDFLRAGVTQDLEDAVYQAATAVQTFDDGERDPF